jgi:hypothetical protein
MPEVEQEGVHRVRVAVGAVLEVELLDGAAVVGCTVEPGVLVAGPCAVAPAVVPPSLGDRYTVAVTSG